MGKKTSASDKARHSIYKSDNVYAKNKVAKLTRHLKEFPNDEIAKTALKTASTATSSRFGKKFKKSLRTHLDRVTDPLYRQLRKSAKVYATVKDGDSLVLNGVLFSPEKLVEVFGEKVAKQHKKPVATEVKVAKAKVRRGSRGKK